MKEERTVRISPEEMAAQQAFAREFSSLPERPQTYYIVTYGCQMNAHDSEKLAGMLEEMGMTPAPAREEADFVLLSTATRNWRAILHFYIDELGMEFWSARLFKPLDKGLK